MQNIGEDLFAIALDQPFRFPATFTFVLRAFSTLEGLGKVMTRLRAPGLYPAGKHQSLNNEPLYYG